MPRSHDAIDTPGHHRTARRLSPLPGWPRRMLLGALLMLSLTLISDAMAAKCLFVSSYHQGYEWSDGVERGVRSTLKNHCELKQFDMDAKRHKEPHELAQKAREAKALIEAWQPDVVITADDDAAKYLIMPYYKDHAIPFVFCGINWTVEEYGFPYRNATGMIEVAPVTPLFEQAETLLPVHGRAFYLGANTSTERKNLAYVQDIASRRGIHLEHRLVDTTAAWISEFQAAQAYDFLVLGSNAGINDWQEAQVREAVKNHGRRLSLTTHEWMMPYTMLGLTKVPEEQGQWAAQSALHILSGVEPASIPIIANRKWDIWVNSSLVETTSIRLPKPLVHKAKKAH